MIPGHSLYLSLFLSRRLSGCNVRAGARWEICFPPPSLFYLRLKRYPFKIKYSRSVLLILGSAPVGPQSRTCPAEGGEGCFRFRVNIPPNDEKTPPRPAPRGLRGGAPRSPTPGRAPPPAPPAAHAPRLPRTEPTPR